MITDLNKIINEWAFRTHNGKPNPQSMAHQILLEGVLKDFGWSFEQRDELLYTLMEQPSDRERLMKQVIKYKNKDGEDKEISVGGALVAVGGDQKVVMNAADVIKVSSSAASSIDVTLSILEIT